MPIRTKQLAHVCIFADDLAETRDFYRDVLGMEIVFNFSARATGTASTSAPAAAATSRSSSSPRPSTATGTRSTTSASRSNRSTTPSPTSARGASPVTDKKFACDDTYQAWITDPNGVRIELFEYTAKSAQFVGGDRVADW